MPTEVTATSPSEPDITKPLLELEVPFSPDQVQWRMDKYNRKPGAMPTHHRFWGDEQEWFRWDRTRARRRIHGLSLAAS